jgi:tRNA nucleotidyltransferase (CCA-adding enzyme)
MSLYIPKELEEISKKLISKGKRAILVGGSVRDHFLRLSIKDYDIEVFGVENIEELEEILKNFGTINLVGKSFGVLKLRVKNFEFDFSIPRVEKKISKGHNGFIVNLKKDINFKEATQRRDFTINAIGFDILSKDFLDPQNGIVDIKKGVLRHIDSKRFQEDPLRVYRGVQFVARFELKIEKDTFTLLQNMVENTILDELPKERIYIEIKKLFLKSKKPSIGIELMKELGILDRYFPELLNIKLKSIDRVSKYKDLKLIFASIGFFNPRQNKQFLIKLTDEKRFIDEVLNLTDTLIKYKDKKILKKVDINRISTTTKVEDFLRLARVLIKIKNYRQVKKTSKRLNIYRDKLHPIIKGRDLIELGMRPSKEFKHILNRLYQAQIEDKINSPKEAFELLKRDYLQRS